MALAATKLGMGFLALLEVLFLEASLKTSTRSTRRTRSWISRDHTAGKETKEVKEARNITGASLRRSAKLPASLDLGARSIETRYMLFRIERSAWA